MLEKEGHIPLEEQLKFQELAAIKVHGVLAELEHFGAQASWGLVLLLRRHSHFLFFIAEVLNSTHPCGAEIKMSAHEAKLLSVFKHVSKLPPALNDDTGSWNLRICPRL